MPIIIPEFKNMYLSLYMMTEIATHPHAKWQKSRPIPIPELKNCDPSERHLRTRHFLGVNPRANRIWSTIPTKINQPIYIIYLLFNRVQNITRPTVVPFDINKRLSIV